MKIFNIIILILSTVTFTIAQGTVGEYVPGTATGGFDSGCGYPDASGTAPGPSDTGLTGNTCGSAFDVSFGAWTESGTGFDITGFELNNYDIDLEAVYGIRLFYGPQNNCCTICLDAMLDLSQGTPCGTFGAQADLGSFGFPVPALYGADVFGGVDVIPYSDMCPNTEYFAQYQFLSASGLDLTDPDGNFCAMDDALITNAGTQSAVQTLVAPGTRDPIVINSTTLALSGAADCGAAAVLLDFTADITAGCTVSFGTCSQGLEFEFRGSLACADGSALDITTGPLINDPTGCFIGAAFAAQISLGTAAEVCAILECDPNASLELYTTYTFCEADDIVGDGSGNDEAVMSVSIASILASFDAAACCAPAVCSGIYEGTMDDICSGAPGTFTFTSCDVVPGGGGTGGVANDFDLYIYAPGGIPGMAPAGYIPNPVAGTFGQFPIPNADLIYEIGTFDFGQTCPATMPTFPVFNATCAPMDVTYFLVPYDYTVDLNPDPLAGDFGFYPDNTMTDVCQPIRFDIVVNPIFEIIEDTTNGCNPIAGAFASDGAGGFFDQDGDGLLTFADACITDELAADCADGATLDYDFSALDVGACSGDLTGTLTCVCAVPACLATYEGTMDDICSGAPGNFTFTSCDVIPGGGGTGGVAYDFDLYIYAPGGIPGMAPAGYIPNPVAGTFGQFPIPNADLIYEIGTFDFGQTCPATMPTFPVFNATCAPMDVTYFLVPYDYTIDLNPDPLAGDFGFYPDNTMTDVCQPIRFDIVVNPIFEIIEDTTNGCNPIAGAFASDGAGGFFDQDGDGLLTFADACITDELAADCADGATLDYDFSALDVGVCSGDLTGTLTCVCAPSTCASSYSYSAPPEICNGSDINFIVDAGCNISLNQADFGGGTNVDPSLDLDFYLYIDPATGAPGQAPAGLTVIPADIDGGATGNPDIAYVGTAGAPTTVGNGCGDFTFTQALFNGTCGPITVTYFVVPYTYDLDTDGDGTFGAYLMDGNPLACSVQQIDVIVNPIYEILEDVTNGCDPIVGAFATDGLGGFFDTDGDLALTFADACVTAQLNPTANCEDGSTLDYDFSGVDIGACSGDLTGTLTCICPVACDALAPVIDNDEGDCPVDGNGSGDDLPYIFTETAIGNPTLTTEYIVLDGPGGAIIGVFPSLSAAQSAAEAEAVLNGDACIQGINHDANEFDALIAALDNEVAILLGAGLCTVLGAPCPNYGTLENFFNSAGALLPPGALTVALLQQLIIGDLSALGFGIVPVPDFCHMFGNESCVNFETCINCDAGHGTLTIKAVPPTGN